MTKILVPIDFSLESANALNFAHQLSLVKGMKLTLLHCYPIEEYNRKLIHGKKKYGKGIRKMLIDFYHKHINKEIGETRFVAEPGSIVQMMGSVSFDYKLIVLSGNKYNSAFIRWIGSKASFIASKAKCPVIIVPPSTSYSSWDNIWQLQRSQGDRPVVEFWLNKLNLDPAIVQIKSLTQTSFTSAIWKSFIAYVKKPKEELREIIEAAKPNEIIDLILLVSHQKDSFHKFVNDETIQIVFQFGIPVMIFQADSVG